MNFHVLSAIFKRNLVSYFSSPLGYLFIGLFVLLSAVAEFYPDEFFNANLANLDQLNKAFPFIMLFFVPAITMSIWADEVRQGTDELLLTMPATDFDIVLGKYLAAVTIYSVSLLISGISNGIVLSFLGKPDAGLYVCTHLGYWLLGLSMLAVGMVASFLTRNLTVAYVLGALFNLPLVAASRIDVVPGLTREAAAAISTWSFGGQCEVFGRGVLSLAGGVYFLLVAAIMLYLCVVLLGRRHWARGDDAGLQSGHFALRCLSLTAMAAALVVILQNNDVRRDATSEQLTALSSDTKNLIGELEDDYKQAVKLQKEMAPLEEEKQKALNAEKKAADDKLAKEKAAAKSSAAAPAVSPGEAASNAKLPKPEDKKASEPKKPAAVFADAAKLDKLKAEFDKLRIQERVQIDAYISPEVPDSYIQTRINLLNVLDEFKRLGQEGGMMEVNVHQIDRFDKLAEVAKTRYGIVPRDTFDTRNGAWRNDKIFLGVAFTCGLEKVVVPFIDRGLTPEYELVRSLCTVTKQKRKRIGVLETDAHVMGGFMGGGTPEWLLTQELKKQYEVVSVNPTELMAPTKPGEAEKRYDVLLAVQPSAMGSREMESFVATIRAGQPTVIFEDPFLFRVPGVPGTYQPRQQQQNPMMGFNNPEGQEKGDIRKLWRLLGIDFSDGGEVEFNPMAGGSPPGGGSEKIVWQRYNPYPKFGNTLYPEYVFIDHACGAAAPFDEDDPISSKLQHLLTFGPGFIEDTPEAVKRLVAKWHNKQYAAKLHRDMTDLETQLDAADKNSDEEKVNELIDKAADLDQEYSQVSTGGDGTRGATIQPAELHADTDLESLMAKLLGKGHNSAMADLVADLKNRYPLAEDEADESRTVLLTKGAAEKLADEAQQLEKDADGLRQRSAGEPRFAAAAKLKVEAAKLKQSAARMTTDGLALAESGSSDAALLKMRIAWTASAAGLKDQAAKLMSKAEQRPGAAILDKADADHKVQLAAFKEQLAKMQTVADVVKYAQDAVALQLPDRQFAPLVQTGPDGGTVPVNQLIVRDMFNPRPHLNEFRSLFYQPSRGQSYVLAAHITNKPRDSFAGSPINVIVVADVDAVSDEVFEMREKGKFPGQDIVYDFDNVTFVLNALDTLANETRFLDIRKRRPQHRTLAQFEEHAREARKEGIVASEKQREDHDKVIRNAMKKVEAAKKRVTHRVMKEKLDETAAAQLMATELNLVSRNVEEERAETDREYDRKLEQVTNDLDAKVNALRGTYKLWAVAVPPIPLLLVAAAVFFHRRAKEREGVSAGRLR
jgi:hypothetical protein